MREYNIIKISRGILVCINFRSFKKLPIAIKRYYKDLLPVITFVHRVETLDTRVAPLQLPSYSKKKSITYF